MQEKPEKTQILATSENGSQLNGGNYIFIILTIDFLAATAALEVKMLVCVCVCVSHLLQLY